MIVKILGNKGGGSAGAAIDYMLGKERDREGAILISGDPDLTARLADNLDFQNRYTVGVLSFEEANLEEQQKQKIMQSFEETLLAGLDRDQYDITWIEHIDKGRLEQFRYSKRRIKYRKTLTALLRQSRSSIS